jgi:3,4-dihydroxy 2-butanone 4-phosphate synthase / GTP cyclohydrolase II
MTTRESHLLVEEVAAAFGRGEMVVVADDDDRENEGDLFVAASMCTAEKMAFIIRHTSGIVCAPLSVDEAKRLHLDPMVALNDAPLGTAFTVSVDVRHGLTTGISADERTNTVRALGGGGGAGGGGGGAAPPRRRPPTGAGAPPRRWSGCCPSS